MEKFHPFCSPMKTDFSSGFVTDCYILMRWAVKVVNTLICFRAVFCPFCCKLGTKPSQLEKTIIAEDFVNVILQNITIIFSSHEY